MSWRCRVFFCLLYVFSLVFVSAEPLKKPSVEYNTNIPEVVKSMIHHWILYLINHDGCLPDRSVSDRCFNVFGSGVTVACDPTFQQCHLFHPSAKSRIKPQLFSWDIRVKLSLDNVDKVFFCTKDIEKDYEFKNSFRKMDSLASEKDIFNDSLLKKLQKLLDKQVKTPVKLVNMMELVTQSENQPFGPLSLSSYTISSANDGPAVLCRLRPHMDFVWNRVEVMGVPLSILTNPKSPYFKTLERLEETLKVVYVQNHPAFSMKRWVKASVNAKPLLVEGVESNSLEELPKIVKTFWSDFQERAGFKEPFNQKSVRDIENISNLAVIFSPATLKDYEIINGLAFAAAEASSVTAIEDAVYSTARLRGLLFANTVNDTNMNKFYDTLVSSYYNAEVDQAQEKNLQSKYSTSERGPSFIELMGADGDDGADNVVTEILGGDRLHQGEVDESSTIGNHLQVELPRAFDTSLLNHGQGKLLQFDDPIPVLNQRGSSLINIKKKEAKQIEEDSQKQQAKDLNNFNKQRLRIIGSTYLYRDKNLRFPTSRSQFKDSMIDAFLNLGLNEHEFFVRLPFINTPPDYDIRGSIFSHNEKKSISKIFSSSPPPGVNEPTYVALYDRKRRIPAALGVHAFCGENIALGFFLETGLRGKRCEFGLAPELHDPDEEFEALPWYVKKTSRAIVRLLPKLSSIFEFFEIRPNRETYLQYNKKIINKKEVSSIKKKDVQGLSNLNFVEEQETTPPSTSSSPTPTPKNPNNSNFKRDISHEWQSDLIVSAAIYAQELHTLNPNYEKHVADLLMKTKGFSLTNTLRSSEQLKANKELISDADDSEVLDEDTSTTATESNKNVYIVNLQKDPQVFSRFLARAARFHSKIALSHQNPGSMWGRRDVVISKSVNETVYGHSFSAFFSEDMLVKPKCGLVGHEIFNSEQYSDTYEKLAVFKGLIDRIGVSREAGRGLSFSSKENAFYEKTRKQYMTPPVMRLSNEKTTAPLDPCDFFVLQPLYAILNTLLGSGSMEIIVRPRIGPQMLRRFIRTDVDLIERASSNFAFYNSFIRSMVNQMSAMESESRKDSEDYFQPKVSQYFVENDINRAKDSDYFKFSNYIDLTRHLYTVTMKVDPVKFENLYDERRELLSHFLKNVQAQSELKAEVLKRIHRVVRGTSTRFFSDGIFTLDWDKSGLQNIEIDEPLKRLSIKENIMTSSASTVEDTQITLELKDKVRKQEVKYQVIAHSTMFLLAFEHRLISIGKNNRLSCLRHTERASVPIIISLTDEEATFLSAYLNWMDVRVRGITAVKMVSEYKRLYPRAPFLSMPFCYLSGLPLFVGDHFRAVVDRDALRFSIMSAKLAGYYSDITNEEENINSFQDSKLMTYVDMFIHPNAVMFPLAPASSKKTIRFFSVQYMFDAQERLIEYVENVLVPDDDTDVLRYMETYKIPDQYLQQTMKRKYVFDQQLIRSITFALTKPGLTCPLSESLILHPLGSSKLLLIRRGNFVRKIAVNDRAYTALITRYATLSANPLSSSVSERESRFGGKGVEEFFEGYHRTATDGYFGTGRPHDFYFVLIKNFRLSQSFQVSSEMSKDVAILAEYKKISEKDLNTHTKDDENGSAASPASFIQIGNEIENTLGSNAVQSSLQDVSRRSLMGTKNYAQAAVRIETDNPNDSTVQQNRLDAMHELLNSMKDASKNDDSLIRKNLIVNRSNPNILSSDPETLLQSVELLKGTTETNSQRDDFKYEDQVTFPSNINQYEIKHFHSTRYDQSTGHHKHCIPAPLLDSKVLQRLPKKIETSSFVRMFNWIWSPFSWFSNSQADILPSKIKNSDKPKSKDSEASSNKQKASISILSDELLSASTRKETNTENSNICAPNPYFTLFRKLVTTNSDQEDLNFENYYTNNLFGSTKRGLFLLTPPDFFEGSILRTYSFKKSVEKNQDHREDPSFAFLDADHSTNRAQLSNNNAKNDHVNSNPISNGMPVFFEASMTSLDVEMQEISDGANESPYKGLSKEEYMEMKQILAEMLSNSKVDVSDPHSHSSSLVNLLENESNSEDKEDSEDAKFDDSTKQDTVASEITSTGRTIHITSDSDQEHKQQKLYGEVNQIPRSQPTASLAQFSSAIAFKPLPEFAHLSDEILAEKMSLPSWMMSNVDMDSTSESETDLNYYFEKNQDNNNNFNIFAAISMDLENDIHLRDHTIVTSFLQRSRQTIEELSALEKEKTQKQSQIELNSLKTSRDHNHSPLLEDSTKTTVSFVEMQNENPVKFKVIKQELFNSASENPEIKKLLEVMDRNQIGLELIYDHRSLVQLPNALMDPDNPVPSIYDQLILASFQNIVRPGDAGIWQFFSPLILSGTLYCPVSNAPELASKFLDIDSLLQRYTPEFAAFSRMEGKTALNEYKKAQQLKDSKIKTKGNKKDVQELFSTKTTSVNSHQHPSSSFIQTHGLDDGDEDDNQDGFSPEELSRSVYNPLLTIRSNDPYTVSLSGMGSMHFEPHRVSIRNSNRCLILPHIGNHLEFFDDSFTSSREKAVYALSAHLNNWLQTRSGHFIQILNKHMPMFTQTATRTISIVDQKTIVKKLQHNLKISSFEGVGFVSSTQFSIEPNDDTPDILIDQMIRSVAMYRFISYLTLYPHRKDISVMETLSSTQKLNSHDKMEILKHPFFGDATHSMGEMFLESHPYYISPYHQRLKKFRIAAHLYRSQHSTGNDIYTPISKIKKNKKKNTQNNHQQPPIPNSAFIDSSDATEMFEGGVNDSAAAADGKSSKTNESNKDNNSSSVNNKNAAEQKSEKTFNYQLRIIKNPEIVAKALQTSSNVYRAMGIGETNANIFFRYDQIDEIKEKNKQNASNIASREKRIKDQPNPTATWETLRKDIIVNSYSRASKINFPWLKSMLNKIWMEFTHIGAEWGLPPLPKYLNMFALIGVNPKAYTKTNIA